MVHKFSGTSESETEPKEKAILALSSFDNGGELIGHGSGMIDLQGISHRTFSPT